MSVCLIKASNGTVTTSWDVVQRCEAWRKSLDEEYIAMAGKRELHLPNASTQAVHLVLEWLSSQSVSLPGVWQIARHGRRYILHGSIENISLVIDVAHVAHKFLLRGLLDVCDDFLDLRGKSGGGVAELHEGNIDWASPSEVCDALSRVVQAAVQLGLPKTLVFFSTLTPFNIKSNVLGRLLESAAASGSLKTVEWLMGNAPYPAIVHSEQSKRARQAHAVLKRRVADSCCRASHCSLEILQFVAEHAKEYEIQGTSALTIYDEAFFVSIVKEKLLASENEARLEQMCVSLAHWEHLWEMGGAFLMGCVLSLSHVGKMEAALRGIHAGLHDRGLKQDPVLIATSPLNVLPPVETCPNNMMELAEIVARVSPHLLAPPLAIYFCHNRRYSCCIRMMVEGVSPKCELLSQQEALWAGMTPLSEAARNGDIAAVQAILSQSEDDAVLVAAAPHVLVAATCSERVQVIDLVLQTIHDQPIVDGEDALIMAACNLQTTRRLLAAGIPPAKSAFAKASSFGKLEVVRLLLQAGGDPSWGLHEAVEHGHTSVAMMLLREDATALSHEPLLHAIAQQDLGLAMRLVPVTPILDETATPPLHSAAAWGNLELVKCLLKHGHSIAAVDAAGKWAIDCVQRGNREVEDVLVESDVLCGLK